MGLPRPWDQQWSLRLQQILAYETDLLEFGDIFDGSQEIARKVEDLKAEAKAELRRIEEMGGAVAAIGYMKQRLVESNAERVRSIETGEQTVVGVNRWSESEPSPLSAGESIIEVVDEQRGARAGGAVGGMARSARRAAVKQALARAGAGGQGGTQCHGAVHRLRQGGRDDGRMGRVPA